MKEKDELTELGEKIERGLKISFQKLIAFKKYKNTPFVLQQKGKIVKISAEEMERRMKESKHLEPYKKKDEVHFANEPSEKVKRKK